MKCSATIDLSFEEIEPFDINPPNNNHTGVFETDSPLHTSHGHAMRRQQMLSTQQLGALKADLPEGLLLRSFVHRHRYLHWS